MNLSENVISQFEADTIHFAKGDTISSKLINFKGDYKGNLYVVIDRSSKKNQDAHGMYLTDKKLKVIHSFGSHPSKSTQVPPDSQIKRMIDTANYLGEAKSKPLPKMVMTRYDDKGKVTHTETIIGKHGWDKDIDKLLLQMQKGTKKD